jgi:hypothetical protein
VASRGNVRAICQVESWSVDVSQQLMYRTRRQPRAVGAHCRQGRSGRKLKSHLSIDDGSREILRHGVTDQGAWRWVCKIRRVLLSVPAADAYHQSVGSAGALEQDPTQGGVQLRKARRTRWRPRTKRMRQPNRGRLEMVREETDLEDCMFADAARRSSGVGVFLIHQTAESQQTATKDRRVRSVPKSMGALS